MTANFAITTFETLTRSIRGGCQESQHWESIYQVLMLGVAEFTTTSISIFIITQVSGSEAIAIVKPINPVKYTDPDGKIVIAPAICSFAQHCTAFFNRHS